MRIAFIVDQFPALSQTFVLRQITGLLDRGQQVDIFAYGPGHDPLRHPDVDHYGLLNRTYYLTACACTEPAPLRVTKRLRLLFTNFPKSPTAVLKALNVARYGKRALFLQILCQISPFFGKGYYDIVHCQFGNLGELGLLLKDTGLFKGKLITSFRGYDISSYVKSFGDDVYRDLFKRGDLFLCVSEHTRHKLLRLGCEESKAVVHRSGVDIRNRLLSQRVIRNNEPLRILTVARLNEKKGVEYGIRAVAHVLQRSHRIKYTIAGDGPLKRKLQDLTCELQVDNNVQLIGWRSQNEIAALLDNSHILLAPSVTTPEGDEEGIPGVIMESFARGLPVVSTLHAGIPEIIKDGKSGFLVRERDVDALADKLLDLIKDPRLRFKMGVHGYKFVGAHFDIEKLNDRLLAIYQKLAEEGISMRDPCVNRCELSA